jgi:hypothetical protein
VWLRPRALHRPDDPVAAGLELPRFGCLWRASAGRGAFRYSRDTLADHLRERERWLAFKDARVRRRALDWQASEGVEPILE